MGVGMASLGSLVYDNLFAGNVADIVTDAGVLASGQNVVRGAVLGKVTATGKLVLVDSTKTDGSQTIYAIAADAVDATAADQPIPLYFTGEFNRAALTFGGTDTYAKHIDAAKAIGIFFKSNVTVGGTY
ncbi:MAG: head decoration protein [Veillonellales bacterium]